MRCVKRIAAGLKVRMTNLFLTVKSLPAWKEELLVTLRHLSVVIFYLSVLFVSMVSGVPLIREQLIPDAPVAVRDTLLEDDPVYLRQINNLRRDLIAQVRRYQSLTPGQNYLVINTTENKFYLYGHRTLKREGFCSSGSYIHLKTLDEREWIFKTPRGLFRIQGKTTYPVWKKPDWAFIEEGLPVPPPDHYSRFEYGALGDYALNIGDGYLIHGTLYNRSLGMPVTHGCIRLNDEDLEYVFNALNVGSKVYIY